MSDVTLVIAGPWDGVITQVADVVAAWTGSGLVEPLLWWAGRADSGHQVRWSGPGATEEPMLSVLGRQRYRVIRLVSLHVPDGTAAREGPDLPAVAEDVEEVILRRLGAQQAVAKINLVVPATGVEALPADLLATYWDVNLVVADDDRRAPIGYVSDDVHDADRLSAHAALALVGAAGLWPGQPGAPFDGRREGGEQEPRLRVVRTFARVVRSYGLVDAVSTQLLDRHENQQWLAEAVEGLPAPEPQVVVDRATTEYLAGPGKRLCREPAPHPRPPRLEPVRPWTALKWMFSFMWHLARDLPSQWVAAALDEGQRRVESFVQGVTFGGGSTKVVQIGPRPAFVQSGPSAAEDDVADRLLEWLGGRPAVPSLADEWRALRALTFGLADAGPMPDGCTEQVSGGRRLVVTDVFAISPDPCDEPFEVDAAALPSEHSGSEYAARPVGPCDPAGALIVARVLGAPDRGEDATAGEPKRFGEWLARRRHALLWRVGERLFDDALAAQEALSAALDRIREGIGPPDVDPRARRRLNLVWLLIALLALAGVGVGTALGVAGVVSAVEATFIVVASLVGWLVASLSVFYPYLKQQFQIAHRHNEQLESYRSALVAAEHEAQELTRLSVACEEYADWAVILGTVLHRPGGTIPEPPADDVELAELPAPLALGLASGATDRRQRMRIAAVVGRQHFHRGWLSALYADIERDSMGELKFELGRNEADPDPDPGVTAEARRRLFADIHGGTSTERFGRRIRTVVVEHVSTLPPGELFSSVSRTDGERVTGPEEFLTEICPQPVRDDAAGSFSQHLWVRRAERVQLRDEEMVWLPTSVRAADDVRRLERSCEEASPVIVLRSVRFDATEPALGSDLRMFPARADEATPSPTVDLGGIG